MGKKVTKTPFYPPSVSAGGDKWVCNTGRITVKKKKNGSSQTVVRWNLYCPICERETGNTQGGEETLHEKVNPLPLKVAAYSKLSRMIDRRNHQDEFFGFILNKKKIMIIILLLPWIGLFSRCWICLKSLLLESNSKVTEIHWKWVCVSVWESERERTLGHAIHLWPSDPLFCFVFSEAWRWKNKSESSTKVHRSAQELTRHLFNLFQKLLILQSLQMS